MKNFKITLNHENDNNTIQILVEEQVMFSLSLHNEVIKEMTKEMSPESFLEIVSNSLGSIKEMVGQQQNQQPQPKPATKPTAKKQAPKQPVTPVENHENVVILKKNGSPVYLVKRDDITPLKRGWVKFNNRTFRISELTAPQFNEEDRQRIFEAWENFTGEPISL